MRRDQIGARGGGNGDGDHRGGGGDETVHHHGLAVGSRAEDDARQPADLEAADFGEHIQAVFGIGLVDRQRALDGADLALQTFIVHACAATRDLCRRLTRQRGGDGGGWSGVADAHVARADDIQSALDLCFDDFHTRRGWTAPPGRGSLLDPAPCSLFLWQLS